jgi:hypothetical protein
MAYEITDRLKSANELHLLNQLSDAVEQKRRENNNKHDVWELSTDHFDFVKKTDWDRSHWNGRRL